MDYLRFINETLKKRGTPISFVSKKAGLNYEVLRKTLAGERPMRADELIAIADVLGYKVDMSQKN